MAGPMDTWSKLSGLTVEIESIELAARSLPAGSFVRHTTLVRLSGSGEQGCGEDVAYDGVDQERFRAARIDWPTGKFDLAGFSAALDATELFDHRPQQEAYRDYRRWAVESAALDLALRQAGRTLADQLDRPLRPLCFVASMGLGHPPELDKCHRLMERVPGLRFKLDANPDWSDEFCERLAGLDRVDVVDFKGAYHGTPVDTPPDAALYRRVAERLPGAVLEDPAWNEETAEALAPYRERIAWDAPIHSVADIEAMPVAPKVLNIKPSRFGPIERLCAAYDYCTRHGIAMYGGGQFELDEGRLQIQTLASLFHPDGSNDVSPVAYHDPENHETLPSSPLTPAPVGPQSGLATRWT